MPKYFAQLNNQGVVERVIVADSLDWCVQNLGGDWVETFMDDSSKNYAGKGHKYHSDKNSFSEPQPFSSWTLDEKLKWKAPKVKPKGKGIYAWDESKKDWKDLTKESK